MNKYSLFLVLAIAISCKSTAQKFDSLLAVWRDSQKSDSLRVDAFKDYIHDAFLYSDPDSAFQLAETLVEFGRERVYSRAIAAGYNLQGLAYWVKGQPAKAIGYYQKCYAVHMESDNKKGMGATLGNIGVIYDEYGDYPKAIDYYHRSLLLCEKAGNKKCMTSALANLGLVYKRLSKFDKALEYIERAQSIHKELNNERGMANSFVSIGGIFLEQNQLDKALEQYLQGLSTLESLNDKQGMTYALKNIGVTFGEKGEYKKALNYLQQSLLLSAELDERRARSSTLTEIGQVYALLGEHHKALTNCAEGEQIARNALFLPEERAACACLYESHKALRQDGEALRYLERIRVIDDSLKSDETAMKLEQMEFAKQLFADSMARAEEARLIEDAHREEIRSKNLTRNYMALGGFVLLLLALGLYSRSRYMRRSRDLISKERDLSENLLLNILPAEVAAELKEKGRAEAREYAQVSILFTDFKGFTEASSRMSPGELVNEINTCFEAFDRIVEHNGLEKIKTIGDAYMAAGGLPIPMNDSAKRTVAAALEMQEFIKMRLQERITQNLPAFEMRVGVHTGPVVAGIVGIKKFQYDIWGDTVNTASRMESSGEVGKVNISDSTYELVKDSFKFEERGEIEVKGKGKVKMFFVEKTILKV